MNQSLQQGSARLHPSFLSWSRVHRCFEIPELAAEICSQCDSRSLATLGRTARLLGCALDVLWSGYHQEAVEIPISRLIKCFPGKIITHLGDNRLSLSAPLEPHHWERFNFYAKRVRNCLLDSRSVDPSFLVLLTSFAPSQGLLPKLMFLCLLGGDELINARGFLSPTLQRLKIKCLVSGYSFVSLLLVLPSLCPNITKLELQIPGSVSDHVIPTLLGKYPLLRKLDLQNISAEHLPLIANLQKLSHLILGGMMDRSPIFPLVWRLPCNALVRVSLTAPPKHIRALFLCLAECPLEEIYIHLESLRADRIQLTEIVRVVTNKCKPQFLRRISINETIGYRVDIASDHLVPFLRFPNITHFRCRVLTPLCLDDAFISSLARSWPSLEILEVATYSVRLPTLTTHSLAMLAFHCPKLSSISLAFDATTFGLDTSIDVSKHHDDKPATLPIGDIRNTSVHKLHVRCSPIGEPELVSAYLDSLFPNLNRISASTPEALYRNRWGSVQRAVRQKKEGS